MKQALHINKYTLQMKEEIHKPYLKWKNKVDLQLFRFTKFRKKTNMIKIINEQVNDINRLSIFKYFEANITLSIKVNF